MDAKPLLGRLRGSLFAPDGRTGGRRVRLFFAGECVSEWRNPRSGCFSFGSPLKYGRTESGAVSRIYYVYNSVCIL